MEIAVTSEPSASPYTAVELSITEERNLNRAQCLLLAIDWVNTAYEHHCPFCFECLTKLVSRYLFTLPLDRDYLIFEVNS